LDLSLPDKTVSLIITEILALVQNIPVIILTGYTDIEFSIKSIAQGISDYLIKDELNALMLYKSILYCLERKKRSAQLKESEKKY
ncbi:response regulator, partial [Acinetobacter baumannii]